MLVHNALQKIKIFPNWPNLFACSARRNFIRLIALSILVSPIVKKNTNKSPTIWTIPSDSSQFKFRFLQLDRLVSPEFIIIPVGSLFWKKKFVNIVEPGYSHPLKMKQFQFQIGFHFQIANYFNNNSFSTWNNQWIWIPESRIPQQKSLLVLSGKKRHHADYPKWF